LLTMRAVSYKIKTTAIFSEGITMIELNRLSWETFTRTGNIDAYLLYKSINDIDVQEDKDDTWRKLEQEALS